MRETPDKLDYSENVGIALSQNLVGPTAAATLTLYSVDSINVKGEDDGVADAPEVAQGSSADDDLTSLTWLQDKNLLKGVRQLPKNEASKKVASCSTIVPTESASIKTTAESSNVVCTMSSKAKDEQTPFSYDPQIHTNSKPPFSFSCLIFMAIEDSPSKALPVKDIYVWIVDHFPYYNNAPTGWKNSVRHNLSLNKCFKKVDKAPNLGKGSLWMVEQRFRPSLINALQKSPYQYIKFIRNFKLNTEPKKLSNSSVKNEIIVDAQHVNEVCSSANTTIVNEEVPVYARDPIEIYKSDEIRFGTENFEDVDAAAAMLVLKHGGYAFNITPDCINLAIANTYQPSANQYVINEEEKPLVTSYPSEDHNYVYDDSVPTNVSVLAVNDYLGNTEEITTTTNIDAEEQRKIAEGADALLNLAGIRTYNTRKRYASSSEESVGAIQQYGKRSKIAQQTQPHTPSVLSSYHKGTKTTDSAESDYDCDNIRNGVSTLERSCGKRRRRINSALYSGAITDGTASDEDEDASNGDTNEDDDDDTETASDEEANFPAVDDHNSRRMVQRKNAKALKKVSLRRTRRTSKSLDVVTNAPTATSTVTVAAKYRGRKVKY